MMLPDGRREYFDRLYAESADPWGFETSWYEQRKYAITLAALPEARYRSAFEPGCSIGVLTDLLAARCDALLSSDIVPGALARAAERLAGRDNVRLERRAVPEAWPGERFDLVVLSELAYYFARPNLEALVDRAVGSLEAGGVLEAVHWRGATDYALSGDATHAVIGSHRDLTNVAHHEEADFVLDVWRVGRSAGAGHVADRLDDPITSDPAPDSPSGAGPAGESVAAGAAAAGPTEDSPSAPEQESTP